MTDDAIKAFLENGGVIQQIKTGVSGIPEGTSLSPWGSPRKAGRPPANAVPTPVADEPDDQEDTK
jgi:hypothetical protein